MTEELPSITDEQAKASLAGARLQQANAARAEALSSRWKFFLGITVILFLHRSLSSALEPYFWAALVLASVTGMIYDRRRKKLGYRLPLGRNPLSAQSLERRRFAKALIVSNIVSVVGTGLTIAALALSAGITLRIANHAPFPPGGFRAALIAIPGYSYMVIFVTTLPEIYAGYIAADIAQRKPLLNGMLSSSLFIIGNVYEWFAGPLMALHDPPIIPHSWDTVYGWSGPVFGLLGAWIWILRKPESI